MATPHLVGQKHSSYMDQTSAVSAHSRHVPANRAKAPSTAIPVHHAHCAWLRVRLAMTVLCSRYPSAKHPRGAAQRTWPEEVKKPHMWHMRQEETQ
ncbi:hypothetical protein Airi02_018960 [Actinoallomurus iriomotensis]|uniref:Uncharacterized protein n=1 Tax=Actinoallomurus iriomotensis TaxID=478107 RepID=A0A9W6S1B5_9ACTN|nr:hypothetical protein Airi02_018960 [Actinoallomurus iriomotensis]